MDWSVQEASGGSVTNAGVFTGSTAGTYHVVATSIVDRTKSAAATVTVTTPPPPTTTDAARAPGSFAGLLPLAALLGWLLWRRRHLSAALERCLAGDV